MNILKDFLSTFSERDRLIMTLYFGLEGDAKSQQEIANIVGLSQSFTSRIIKSCIEKLKIFLQNNGYDNIKIGIDRRNCHSPYEYFSNYEKSVVDKAIDRLSEEEKQIFLLYFTNRKELNKCFTLITGWKINGLGRYISKCTRKVEEYLLINKIYINDEVKSRKEEDIESEFIPLKVNISRVRKR